MTRAIEKFEALAFLRGGRISGFLDAKRTPFYISKVEREVPHIDEQGRSVRTKVWLIEMEAPIDVAALLNVGDSSRRPDDRRRDRRGRGHPRRGRRLRHGTRPFRGVRPEEVGRWMET